jgi:uncharacterized protein (DUF885 family)
MVRAMADSAVTALADDYWEFHRSTAQLWNIDRGDVEQIEQWEDLSRDGVADRIRRLDEFARRADALLHSGGEREQSIVAAVAFSARAMAATLPCQRDLTLVAGVANLATFLTVMTPGYALTTADHGAGYVTKLRGIPLFIDQLIDGLREGCEIGRTAAARSVVRAIRDMDEMLAASPAESALARQSPPTEPTPAEAGSWRAEVVKAIGASVYPALGRYRSALADEVLPRAKSDDRPGLCHLPNGIDHYRVLLWAATSTALSPDDVHRIGLAELAQLDDEYRQLGALALGIADPAAVRAQLRDDPTLRYSTSEELITDATALLARAVAESPAWFARMPAATCRSVAVRGGPLAYYTAPSPDGARPGTCYFSVADPTLWTRASFEAVMFHESVPGHHLQLALAQERDLHPVLGELEVVSFGEGWGLYAERLADEMSLYSGPLQRLGMLSLDSLRAARLVVDTGLHALGWSRRQAIEVLAGSTALRMAAVEVEVDRYLADPGQAASYMIGRLEIERIRRDAANRLGDRFSLPHFHDVVLGNGMTPLPQLERVVASWSGVA